MSINSVLVDGIVQHPALRYAADGKPEYRFVLEHVDEFDGRRFTLYVSCCASGKAAERLHEALDEGMAIQVTGGKICYRRRQTQQGELSRMEIFVWAVKPLAGEAQDERTDRDEGDSPSAVEIVQPRGNGERLPSKKGKPRYPKSLGQPWPRGLVSEN